MRFQNSDLDEFRKMASETKFKWYYIFFPLFFIPHIGIIVLIISAVIAYNYPLQFFMVLFTIIAIVYVSVRKPGSYSVGLTHMSEEEYNEKARESEAAEKNLEIANS
jgi:membrane protein implicated in regulation of membrane protease activity